MAGNIYVATAIEAMAQRLFSQKVQPRLMRITSLTLLSLLLVKIKLSFLKLYTRNPF